jgi:phage/plasmid-like protein (TIGR03299 family)
MDWQIEPAYPRYATSHDQKNDPAAWQTMKDSHILLRSDTKAALAIVSSKFKVVQPRKILYTMADWAEESGMTLETAGTLHGGRKFWALAKIGAQTVIKHKADIVGGYILLATACDGSMATIAKRTSIRVVCQNTLNASLRGAADCKVSHRSTLDTNAMRDELGLAREQFVEWSNTMRALADTRVSIDTAERVLIQAVTGQELQSLNAEKLAEARDKAAFKKMLALFEGEGRGATLEGVKGTAWGLLNACTEYNDHHARATSIDNRLESAWFGPGEKMKGRVLELLTA